MQYAVLVVPWLMSVGWWALTHPWVAIYYCQLQIATELLSRKLVTGPWTLTMRCIYDCMIGDLFLYIPVILKGWKGRRILDIDMSDRASTPEDFRKKWCFEHVELLVLKWSKTKNSVEPFETVWRCLYLAGWEIVQNRFKPFHAINKICCTNSVEPFQTVLRYFWIYLKIV